MKRCLVSGLTQPGFRLRPDFSRRSATHFNMPTANPTKNARAIPPMQVVSRKRTAAQANLTRSEERAPKRRQTNNPRPLARPLHIKRFTPPPPRIKERPTLFSWVFSRAKDFWSCASPLRQSALRQSLLADIIRARPLQTDLYMPVLPHTDREVSPSASDSPIPGAFPHHIEILSSSSEGAKSPLASNGAPPTSPSSSPRSNAPSPLSQHGLSQPQSAPASNSSARLQTPNTLLSRPYSYYRTGGIEAHPHNSSPGKSGKIRRAVPMTPAGPQTRPPRRHIHYAQVNAPRFGLDRELIIH